MPQTIVRKAVPLDAPQISVLYDEAYKPPDGGKASDHYPFPQILDSGWVAQAISDGWVYWVIAECNGQIVGSAAAVRNIGSMNDRVVEVFGIVVRVEARRAGCAKQLLAALCDGLGDGPQFILCESRTALAAGWKVARGGGFSPLGFEPFAHCTPAGSEAMLLTGLIRRGALAARVTDTLYTPVKTLADAVLGNKVSAVSYEPDPGRYPLHGQTWSELAPACQQLSMEPPAAGVEALSLVTVCRDDRVGKQLIEETGEKHRHRSGVIAFRRFEGDAPQRYDRQYHVVRAGQHALAAALVVYDRIDQRARILNLRTKYEGLQGVLLAAVVAALVGQASSRRLVIVIDICADACKLQETLLALDFRPTIYYPSFIARGSARVDGIQYTGLINCEFGDSLDCLDRLDWPSATAVIKAVRSGFLQEAGAVRGIP